MNIQKSKIISKSTFMWLILMTLISFNANAIVPQAERDALVVLYNSTGGDNWTDNSNWLVGDPCDDAWHAIVCSNDSKIIMILMGTWPAGNNLTGTLPIELGNLTNLTKLDFNYNNLSGVLPNEIGNLVNLDILYLEQNQLSGAIPNTIGNLINLRTILLGFNQFTGSIPSEIGNLTKLVSLGLQYNILSGDIPPELGNLNTSLSQAFLSFNQLTGIIPPELGNLNRLTELWLNNNGLTGSIPPELGNNNISFLRRVNISSNQLSGSIPIEILNLNHFNQELSFDYNALHSNDPNINIFLDTICNCDWQSTQTTAAENLQIITASDNSISLNWDEVTYQQHGGYKVLMADDALGPFNEINETISKTVTAHTQGNLNAGQNYYFKLITFTNPHSSNQNKVISDASDEVLDTTDLTAGSAEIWSTITSANLQQATIGGFIEYKITVGNNGPDDAHNTGFRHNLPTGLSGGLWSCINLSGAATCPSANGTDNIDLLLNLPTNSSLEFTLTAQVVSINGSSLLITTTITPPDGISDSDLLTNIQFLNFERVFANSFE